ncbi:MAG: galactosamine-6-phosphate isomerase [Bacteroidota bacterium]|nr:galactosamine-6-phosphate isomerase [Bacteroidota bacterium]
MQITNCHSYQEMSDLAASLVLEELVTKPDLLLCAVTGGSPEGLYRELVRTASRERSLFKQIRIMKLDEWGGVPAYYPVTCDFYLRKKVLEPLGIPKERFISFASDPEDPAAECRKIRSRLKKEGPIDICILGLGRNGHLGFNEPAPELEPYCHVAELSAESIQHDMIASLDRKPKYGLTLGMQEILSSRKIIMLVSGKDKKQMVKKFLEGKISTALPASLLHLHPRVECLVNRGNQD